MWKGGGGDGWSEIGEKLSYYSVLKLIFQTYFINFEGVWVHNGWGQRQNI